MSTNSSRPCYDMKQDRVGRGRNKAISTNEQILRQLPSVHRIYYGYNTYSPSTFCRVLIISPGSARAFSFSRHDTKTNSPISDRSLEQFLWKCSKDIPHAISAKCKTCCRSNGAYQRLAMEKHIIIRIGTVPHRRGNVFLEF